ncbi:MAG: HupE/UreJ family protein [Gammaproteobacteria bacterium]|nr:MAG: HupE/UreJ family protein [Gammaproteobacteria bacterium]
MVQLLYGLLLMLLIWSNAVSAHELRAGFLFLNEVREGQYSVLWKIPISDKDNSDVVPVFPDDCRAITPVTHEKEAAVLNRRYVIRCNLSLTNRNITIQSLKEAMLDVMVRVKYQNGSSESGRLTGERNQYKPSGAERLFDIAKSYMQLGIKHILLGFDHLLFVLSLLLFVEGFWRLLKTITAFTVAHSITLAAATLGYVVLPSGPIEIIIALSIVFMASEIARKHMRGHYETDLTERFPWFMVFMFGLVHGFGFAGALSESGLPDYALVPALLFFNIGIELGQIFFISGVILLNIAILNRVKMHTSLTSGRLVTAYGIGGISSFWLIEQVANSF